MALVDGTKKKKSSFFITTKTALTRGWLFLTGDRPDESTFRNLIESIPFFSESSDRAKEEDGSSNLENLQGLGIAANDSQVIERSQAKSTFKTWFVQPTQVTEAADAGSTTVIGSVDASAVGGGVPFDGNTVTVARDAAVTTHNKYIVTMTSAFWAWLGGLFDQVQNMIPKLLPSGGVTGDQLLKSTDSDYETEWVTPVDCCVNDFSLSSSDDFPDDADLIVWIDSTSFSGTNRTSAINLAVNYYGNLVSSRPTFIGHLLIIDKGLEDWVDWARQYVNPTFTFTPAFVYEPDGTGGIASVTPVAITTPTNLKTVQLTFIDEANTIYTGSSIGDVLVGPTADFITDYSEFTAGDTSGYGYSSYSFFRGIVYMVNGIGGGAQLANLQSNVVQAIDDTFLSYLPSTLDNNINGNGTGLWSVADAGWVSTTLDFLSDGSNGFAYAGYNGLKNYGFSYVLDLPTGNVNSISNSDFKEQVDNALAGGDGYKTITITGTVSLADGSQFSSSTSFDVPV